MSGIYPARSTPICRSKKTAAGATNDIDKRDILANLPYDERCGLWFDHHFSNQPKQSFEGHFKLAPSAARVIFEYYKDRFQRDFNELVRAADKIDSADLSVDDILNPGNDPYFLLSLTLSHATYENLDEAYLNRLVARLQKMELRTVLEDVEVKKQCSEFLEQNAAFKQLLITHVTVKDRVSIIDFRPVYPVRGESLSGLHPFPADGGQC